MNQWPEQELGDITDLVVGPAFKSTEFTDDPTDVPLLRGANVGVGQINWSDTKYWPAERAPEFERFDMVTGDVVLAMDRPWIDAGLKVAVFRERDRPALLVQRVARLRSSNGARQRFIQAVVRGPAFSEYLRSIAGGTAVPHISAADIRRFRLRVPSSDSQATIGAFLSAFDELIEINERRIELLEEGARSLYREWFVRFRFPGHGDAELVDSELGPIPEGWRPGRLADLAEIAVETVDPANLDTTVPYVGLEHLPRRHTTLREWGEPGSVKSRKVRFATGDTLFGKIRPYFHKVVWAPFDGAASSDAIVLRPPAHAAALVNAIASSDEFVADAVAHSNGTKMPRADPKAMLDFQVPCPPADDELLSRFEEAVGRSVNESAALVQQNRALAATRDLLLPRLVTGRLDISDIDLGVLTPAEAA